MEGAIDQVRRFADRVIADVCRVWVGSRRTVERALAAVLAGGHLLLEDVPGVGKTLLALSLSRAMGCRFTRLQLTPDLLPADVTGFTVYDQHTGTFRFRPGPVFTHILLADEINRALPRTQSSLLEAMQEGAVSVDGETHPLPRPFAVLATQNPVDSEGTYPLPEAQRDRFMMKLSLGYPSLEDEAEILRRFGTAGGIRDAREANGALPHGGDGGPNPSSGTGGPEEVCRMQQLVPHVHVAPAVQQYLLAFIRATREHEAVLLGASPRASLALLRAAQATAAIEGRGFVLPDDVKALAVPVLAHRLVLRPEAVLRGMRPEDVVEDLLKRVPIPVETHGQLQRAAQG